MNSFESMSTSQESQDPIVDQVNKKSKKEKPYIVFTVKGMPFVIERKHVPDSGPLRIMIDDESDSDKIIENKEDELKMDTDVLRVLINNIHATSTFPVTKTVLTYDQYLSLLRMINYFNLIYDHQSMFELHWIYKYNIVCEGMNQYLNSKCCGIKQICIFTVSNDSVSVYIKYISNDKVITVSKLNKIFYRESGIITIGLTLDDTKKRYIEYVNVSHNTNRIIYCNMNAVCDKCFIPSKITCNHTLEFDIKKMVPRNIVFKSDQGEIEIS